MAGRATQVARRVAIAPDNATVRTTQVTRRVAVEPEATVRLTQVARRVLVPRSNGSFTADAEIYSGATTVPGSITANATTKRELTNSFVADAVELRSYDTSFLADAIFSTYRLGSFVADAIRFATASGTFTADAIIPGGVVEVPGDFTANSIISRGFSASLPGDAIVLQASGSSLVTNAVLTASVSASFTANARIFRTQAGSYTAASISKRGQLGSFTSDARIRIIVSSSASANAIARRTQAASFAADALLVRLQFVADAVVQWTEDDKFYVGALIVPNTETSFSADSTILRIASVGASANTVLLRSAAVALFADAWIQAGSGPFTWGGQFTTNAYLLLPTASGSFAASGITKRTTTSTLTGNAVLYTVPTVKYGSVTVDAWTIGTVASFLADAQISTPTTSSGSFAANATVSSAYRVSGWTAEAVVRFEESDSFEAAAYFGWVFRLDAWIVGTWQSFAVDSVLLRITSASATADAAVGYSYHASSFSADAAIFVLSTGSMAADAEISDGTYVRFFSWAADAYIRDSEESRSFTADAFIRCWFTADAFIAGTTTLLFNANGDPLWGYDENGDPVYIDPNGNPTDSNGDPILDGDGNPVFIGPSGDPVDENGDPILDGEGNPIHWESATRGRAQEVQIIIKKSGIETDITQHVVWSETSFTQQAKTTPGTFSCVLRGKFTEWDGGEDIYVNIDGKRQFGGLVLQVQFDYWFADKADPRTTLLGADYNIYFDKLLLWNKDNTSSTGGYRPPTPYPKNILDSHLIKDACRELLNLPAGFDFYEYVDTLDTTLNPDEKWMINTGQTFRSFMGEISKITNGIWWIDQYLNLHYHSRGSITAPWPISDGAGGISCQNLAFTNDVSSMLNDVRVWGTLAATTEGEIYLAHRDRDSAIEKYGLRQYSEVRSDLHTTDHVTKRANAIINRRAVPIETASLDVFESGFSIGQVVELRLSTFGMTKTLVIRQVDITFATMQPAANGKYYGNPRYHLELGLQPDDPWNIYDMLPWDIPDWPAFPIFDGIDLDPQPCDDGGDGDCSDEICGITDTFTRTLSGSWGTSDVGLIWSSYDLNPTGVAEGVGLFDIVPVLSESGEYVTMVLGDGVSSQTYNKSFDATWSVTFRELDLSTIETVPWINFEMGTTSISCEFGADPEHSGKVQLLLGKSPSGYYIAETTYFFSANTTYKFRLMNTFGSWLGAKIWEASGTEPAGWTLEVSSLEQRSNTGALYTMMIQATGGYGGDSQLTAPLRVSVDDLDIVGVSRCSAYRFDNFERTLASDWGMSDAGYAWVIQKYGASVASVTGGAGKLACAPDDLLTARITATGPWIADCGMTARFKFSTVPSGTPLVTGFYVDSGTAVAGIDINISSSVGDGMFGWAEVEGGSIAKTDWVSDQWYIAEWLRTGSNLKCRLWAEGDTVPAWQVDVAIGSAYGTSFRVMNSSSVSATFYVDYIDFDYDGKPCYQDCVDVAFDSFNRTVVEGLGVADNGVAWSFSGTPTASVSVNGSNAVLTSSTNGQEASIYWNETGSASAPWWNGAPQSTTGRARFWFNFTPPDTEEGYVRLGFDPGDGSSAIVNISNSQGNYGQSGGNTVNKTDWISNTVYIAEWVFNTSTGITSFAVYEEGATPSAWSESYIPPAGASLQLFYINTTSSGTSRPIYIDYIQFQDCSDVTPGGGGGGGGGGDCFDIIEPDEPPWGWYTEVVSVTSAGRVTSRMSPIRGFFSIWYDGKRLTPERDWTAVGDKTFQISSDFMNQNHPVFVTLTYLINAQGTPIAWSPVRTTRTDVRMDGKYPPGVRGID